jgi:hypothetical protein
MADFGSLLAAAIDVGGRSGQATYQTLIDAANGVHQVGNMDRHVIVGLLRSSRSDGWSCIESMLLAAQREEGLRQAILEAADEAHPQAFSRLIDLAVDHNMIRFPATIRALAVWLGFSEDADRVDDASKRLKLLQTCRSDLRLAARRVLEGDPWETYVGLRAIAQHDIQPAVDLARRALVLPDKHNRAAAVRFLAASLLPGEVLVPIFTAVTADPDLAVAATAHRAM